MFGGLTPQLLQRGSAFTQPWPTEQCQHPCCTPSCAVSGTGLARCGTMQDTKQTAWCTSGYFRPRWFTNEFLTDKRRPRLVPQRVAGLAFAGMAIVAAACATDEGTQSTLSGNANEVTSIDVAVSRWNDDAEEYQGGNVLRNSTDLELVREVIGLRGDQTIGLRFQVPIPQGVTVVAAYVQFTADETDTEPTDLSIKGEATGDAVPFEYSRYDISRRKATSATVQWSPPGWTAVGEAGTAQRTPDISDVVQEIVDRSDWRRSNSMVLTISGSGRRVAESYDGSKTAAPRLHIEYTTSQGSDDDEKPDSATSLEPPIDEPDYGGYRPHYQGFGTKTVGGRGGKIYRVTNLKNSGAGSLRAALTASGPRIVVFEVSGTIVLTSSVSVTNPYLTIAGQTAPSPGIAINARCGIRLQTNDVVIQHVRIRRGDYDSCSDLDNVWVRNNAYNIVFDHVSLSWGVDGTLDFNAASGPEPRDISVLDSIVSETLECSIYGAIDPTRRCHSRGMLIAEGTSSTITLARNYFAHNASRNPSASGGWRLANVNNVIYNYAPDTARHGAVAYINGSAKTFFTDRPNEIVQVGTVAIPGGDTPSNTLAIRIQNLAAGSSVFLEDNIAFAMTSPTGSGQWSGVWDSGSLTNQSDFRVNSPPRWYTDAAMRTLPANEVESHVIANAGARPRDRDPVDARVIRDLQNRTGRIIDSQEEVGGMPVLAQRTRRLTIPSGPNDVVAAGRTRIEVWLESLARELER